jgi:hypothetical protein
MKVNCLIQVRLMPSLLMYSSLFMFLSGGTRKHQLRRMELATRYPTRTCIPRTSNSINLVQIFSTATRVIRGMIHYLAERKCFVALQNAIILYSNSLPFPILSSLYFCFFLLLSFSLFPLNNCLEVNVWISECGKIRP